MIRNENPKITVLMSVYNGERYLKEAVDSILAQTFTDFEFVIIDDASTDSTPEILSIYSDPRIRIITNKENLGLTKSLNKGIALSKGEYIARMDADDISVPKRLEKQINFLERNPIIGVLGSKVQCIDESGNRSLITKWPEDDFLIKWQLCFMNPIAHSSVLIRRNLIVECGGYNEKIPFAQDYELWVRLNSKTHFRNHKDILLFIRKTHESISFRKYTEQKMFSHLISIQAMQDIAGATILQSVMDCIIENRISVQCTIEDYQEGLTAIYNSYLSRATDYSLKDILYLRKDIAKRIIMVKIEGREEKKAFFNTIKRVGFSFYYYPFIPIVILIQKLSQRINGQSQLIYCK